MPKFVGRANKTTARPSPLKIIFPWLVALIIAGYPLISTLPILLRTPSRQVSVPFRVFVLGISLLAIFTASRNGRYRAKLFLLPLAVFWGLYSLRILSDTIIFPVQLGRASSEYFLFAFGVTFIPMLAFIARYDTDTLDRAAKLALFIVSSASALALYINRLGFSASERLLTLQGRMATETLNPISLGHLGVTLAILSLVFFLRVRGVAWGWKKILPAGTFALGILTVGVAGSRAPVFAFLAVFLVIVLSEFELRKSLKILAISIIMLFVTYRGFLYLEKNYGFLAVSRVQSAFSTLPEVNDPTRFRLYSDAWQQFLASPLLGSGLEEQNSMFYPHNVVIESFMATGMLGGAAFCLLIVLSLYAVAKRIRGRSSHKWIDFLYLQYLIGAMFSGSLWGNYIMWCLMAAVLILPIPSLKNRHFFELITAKNYGSRPT